MITSRNMMLEKQLLGIIVYTNAAGFLRFSDENGDSNYDPFDNTR